MTDDPQLEELARDLHAIRAEPDPEFARELDRRAAGWLREGERRRWLPSLRVAVPAAAAAAAAIAIALVVVDGGSSDAEPLDVAVVSADAAGGEALSAPAPQAERDSGAHEEVEGALLVRVHNPGDGDIVEVSYEVTERTRAQVRLGDREASVDVPPGGGKLEISTEGLSPGTYDLEVTIPPIPAYRAPVEIRTPG